MLTNGRNLQQSREFDKEHNWAVLERETSSRGTVYLRAAYTLGEDAGAGRVRTIYNGTVRNRKSSRPEDYTRPDGD
jgi:hypothetical protein